MPIEQNNPAHASQFIRLNELWITEHFALEEADCKLAEDPLKVIAAGGHILSLVEEDRVVGVCALFKETDQRYELARMAVDPAERGQGHGDTLIRAALDLAQAIGAREVFLLSNQKLRPALSLYRKHGFETITEGPHPKYARCDIVMGRAITRRSFSLSG